jgi:hypothetical protein
MTSEQVQEHTIDQSRLTFLREISEQNERMVVWKHLDRSLRGFGDIDVAAPADDLDRVTACSLASARSALNASHAVICDHVPSVRLHFYVQPERSPDLFEFDVITQPSRMTSRWAAPSDLVGLSVVDPTGIRRLRPGAESLILLVWQGMSWAGTDQLTGHDRESVIDGLAMDPDGALKACRALAPPLAAKQLRGFVERLILGEWERSWALAALCGFAVTGAASPKFAINRALHRNKYRTGHECLMFGIMRRHGRKMPDGPLSTFLEAAREESHEVIDLESGR